MSKIIASAGINGAYTIVARARNKYEEALGKYGPDREVGFPNTGYFLPIIYGILGVAVKKLSDMGPVLDRAASLLPPRVKETHNLPYLGPALDAGMATFFAEECEEAVRYLDDPNFYLAGREEVTDDSIWLGAADDVIMRKRGVEFVDGTAPGFAAVLGRAPESRNRRANRPGAAAKKPLCLHVLGDRRQTGICRTAGRGRRTDRLEHAACPLRAGYVIGRLFHRLCDPRGDVVREHKTRRFQEDPDL